VSVTDGHGRRVADGGLARWLAGVLPVRLRGEVAIALVPDAHIQQLNRQYRGKDAATDVLSFAPEPGRATGRDPANPRTVTPRTANPRTANPRTANPRTANPRFFGDIVIATGVATRQAREAGHAYRTELRVLALHGFLHLLGYDHDDPDDHGGMARAEARLRRRGGLPGGLIARAAGLPAEAARRPGHSARTSAAKVGQLSKTRRTR
jgi:probable rRNA maturation factor